VFEHQAAFVDMLRVGRDMRKRMFDTLEERHADDFGNGKTGRRLYDDLLSAVRDAGVPEAVTEFESRFLPLLNRKRPHAAAQPGFAADLDVMSAAPGRWRAGWVWAWSLAGVVVIAGALFLGYNFLTTTGQSPTVTEAPPGAGQPAGAASETPAVTEAPVEPPVATGAPVPAEHEQTNERDTPTGTPAQDMPAEPAPDKPADQDPDR
jgi:hypothetical protein